MLLNVYRAEPIHRARWRICSAYKLVDEPQGPIEINWAFHVWVELINTLLKNHIDYVMMAIRCKRAMLVPTKSPCLQNVLVTNIDMQHSFTNIKFACGLLTEPSAVAEYIHLFSAALHLSGLTLAVYCVWMEAAWWVSQWKLLLASLHYTLTFTMLIGMRMVRNYKPFVLLSWFRWLDARLSSYCAYLFSLVYRHTHPNVQVGNADWVCGL